MAIDPGFVAWAGYSAGAGLPVSPVFWKELSPEVRAAWRSAADVVLMNRELQALNPPAGEPINPVLHAGREPEFQARFEDDENDPRIDRAEDERRDPERTCGCTVSVQLDGSDRCDACGGWVES